MQVTRPDVAGKFPEKWLKAYPEDPLPGPNSTPCDDSLTRLHWLLNFSIQSADPEQPNGTTPGYASLQQQQDHLEQFSFPTGGSDSPSSPPAEDTATTGMPLFLETPVTSSPTAPRFADHTHPCSGYHQIPIKANPTEDIDYKTNPQIKPPYSYASLICMAMQASKQPKVTLSNIYAWISENFCYYRCAEPSWQNSIRHNLSLNKCFKKVPRQKNEPGKGGFWQIDPRYADMFVNGIFKPRRTSASHFSTISSSTAHRENKLVQDYHRIQNGSSHQSGFSKRQPLPTMDNKAVRVPESSLLAAEANKADDHSGDFVSFCDDIVNGNYDTFEHVDINTALGSMGYNTEFNLDSRTGPPFTFRSLGRQYSAGLGRWCNSADLLGPNQPINHHQSYGEYMDLSDTSMECTDNVEELNLLQYQQHLNPDHLFLGSHPHLQHLDEFSAEIPDQPEEALFRVWEELEEESQDLPLTQNQGFGLYEGLFTDTLPW